MGVNGNNPALTGVWSIVFDSSYTGVTLNNHSINYVGQTGDYFDIRTDGFIYTKEGLVLDTLKYSQSSDTTISISGFGLIANGVQVESYISNLSIHTLTITAAFAFIPGGVFGRIVYLKR